MALAGFYSNTALDDATGALLRGTTLTLLLPDTQTPATHYTDKTKATPRPALATDNGGFYYIYAPPGPYDLRVGTGAVRRITIAEDPADTISPDQVGVANGVAALGADGKVPQSQLPASTAPFIRVVWNGTWPAARPSGYAIGQVEVMGPTAPTWLLVDAATGAFDPWIPTFT